MLFIRSKSTCGSINQSINGGAIDLASDNNFSTEKNIEQSLESTLLRDNSYTQG